MAYSAFSSVVRSSLEQPILLVPTQTGAVPVVIPIQTLMAQVFPEMQRFPSTGLWHYSMTVVPPSRSESSSGTVARIFLRVFSPQGLIRDHPFLLRAASAAPPPHPAPQRALW